MNRYQLKIIIIFFLLLPIHVFAQKNQEKLIADSLTQIAAKYANVGKISVVQLDVIRTDSTLIVIASDALSYIPFRPENVKRIYSMIANVTRKTNPNYKITCITDTKKIEDLIPNYYLESELDKSRIFDTKYNGNPLIINLSRPYKPTNGLYNKHIALWHSHGLYYNQLIKKWVYQRAKIFSTVEDLFTLSYVLPYLVPMLENAGANLFLPRERDTQCNEVIVDNDNENKLHRYNERTDFKSWRAGADWGFANPKATYLEDENPFHLGTYRIVDCIDDVDELSTAEWIPTIPETGKYAVYVSYKSIQNSAPDARYTVYHKGGQTDFKLNQTMGGGTWIYLGHFMFEKGRSSASKVVLSNYSAFTKKIVVADAVKIGGGMGNIARNPNQKAVLPISKSSDTTKVETPIISTETILPQISNHPRYIEGARYWLQWAGVPDSVYSRTDGKNDYSDDFQSRGFWVNYLAGGSSVLPNRNGLNIPLDLAFAFHTDAGSSAKDSLIGTLGICTVPNSAGRMVFENGASRWSSRDLTDIIQTQISNDIRQLYAPEWVRRGLWNKSYSEARVPEVPTMLLELLSHQNFADMRYGLDPRYRFGVSRAIYKGILRYLHAEKKDFVVQPLPVSNFNCHFLSKNKLQLAWKAVADSLEPTAVADKFILYTRIDDGDFDNGRVVNDSKYTIDLQSGKIYSFRITALNAGGESFPSEILSAYRANSTRPVVLIVNGFDRLGAPVSFTKNHTSAGFNFDADAGVSYIHDYGFIGKQKEFNRSKPYKNDNDAGFGASFSNFADKLIVGNSFDYPYLHGKSIKAAGFSFVSSSLKSVLEDSIDLTKFQIVDLILGKQKKTLLGNGKKASEFKTFPLALQQRLNLYCQGGGSLMVSAAFIASDFYSNDFISVPEKFFSENLLKYKLKQTNANFSSKVTVVPTPYHQFGRAEFDYYDQPNETSIFVESVDAIDPVGEGAFTICRYNGTNLSAGVAYSGKYKICSFGFPFEVIKSEKERNRLMNYVLNFLDTKNKNTHLIELKK